MSGKSSAICRMSSRTSKWPLKTCLALERVSHVLHPGDMPPQLARLQNRIEQCQDKLRAKNDIVLNTVIKSGGATTQEIPDLRFPNITSKLL